MTRENITAEALAAKGWQGCYHWTEDGEVRWTLEEVVEEIRKGAPVAIEIGTLTKTKFAKVGNVWKLWMEATPDEVAAWEAKVAEERRKKALDRIHAKNIARMCRRGR